MSQHAQRLKHVRAELARERNLERFSQVTFAKMLGVHPSTISHIEAGTTRIQLDLAQVIEERTGFRQAWLLIGEEPARLAGWAGSQAPGSGLNMAGAGRFEFTYVKKVKPRLSAGTGELTHDETAEDFYSFRRDWLIRKGNVPDMRLAEVSGDSMVPTLQDGDFVLFDISQQTPRDGKIMVVGIDDLVYIKRVRVSPVDGTFLVSDNKAVYEPWRVSLESARFLGLVVWHCGDV